MKQEPKNGYNAYKVHRIVEYVKTDFPFETDDLIDTGLNNILQGYYNTYITLTDIEYYSILDELLQLAELNELREASRLYKQLRPEDQGEIVFRQSSKDVNGQLSSNSHNCFFSYPVHKCLRALKKVSWPLKPATLKDMKLLEIELQLMKERLRAKNSLA